MRLIWVSEEKLIKANGLLEGSTIAAILLGVMLGGWLADQSVLLAVQVVAGLYLGAAAVNLLIPKLAAIKPLVPGDLARLPRQFVQDTKTLLRNPDARFSIVGTSLFWGMGASLRLLLFAWVPLALGMADNQAPANLMGMVSIGIVVGAGLAGFAVKMPQVNRALIGGLAIGPLLLLLAPTNDFVMAGAVLLGIGAAGGFFAIPLNALLQERGHESVGAGRALAVQNFFENISMLLMAGLYFAALRAGISPHTAIVFFGMLMLVGMAWIGWGRLRQHAFKVRIAAWERDRGLLSAIRRRVFIQEQNIPEALEWDEHDADATHFLAVEKSGQTIGCARLLPNGHLGRVAVAVAWRNQGVGRTLLQAAQREARKLGFNTMHLSAQKQAAGFYLRHGFVIVGDDYMEAGIAHVAMQKNLHAGN